MRNRIGFTILIIALLAPGFWLRAQDKPYQNIANTIIDSALVNQKAYYLLKELTSQIGGRLSGSPQAAAAVEWGRQTLMKTGADRVFLQPVMVPHWVRGQQETAAVVHSGQVGTVPLTITALGGSVATPSGGLTAEVVEVKSLKEAAALGEKARGKIVFYSRPMDRKLRQTFPAYGGAVGQRVAGPSVAAKVGAVAVLVRSMTTRLDDVPHTGTLHYMKGVKRIPAAALSTMDSELLSSLLKKEPHLRVHLDMSPRWLPDVLSYNVIGEIRGSEKPEEIVLLGAHLDSWDLAQGAHDDGAGIVQVIEALRLIKKLGLKPKRTIRGVLYMNEENGLRGGLAYADSSAHNGWKHIAAMESDAGGFTPVGVGVSAPDSVIQSIARWSYLLKQINADRISKGGGGADISPLKKFGVPMLGLQVVSHRYFDYHHSALDTFDKVNPRELELGAATMAIMAYVLAMEGI